MEVLHLGLGFHLKVHPNYILGIAFNVALSLQVNPKSPMGYFEMNLNMAIAFRVGA